MNIETMSTEELGAESLRLKALKAWGPALASIDAELRRRQPVELAQDSYYAGTAADFYNDEGCTPGGWAKSPT